MKMDSDAPETPAAQPAPETPAAEPAKAEEKPPAQVFSFDDVNFD